VRAVRCSERIVDEAVAQLGESSRETLIILLFPTQEPRVLEQEDLARLDALACLEGFIRVSGLDEDHLATDQLGQPLGYGLKRILLLRLSLRPSEMRQDHGESSALQQQLDGGKRGTDAGVVRNLRVLVERHVEVDTKERPLAPQLRVGQIAYAFLFHRHRSPRVATP